MDLKHNKQSHDHSTFSPTVFKEVEKAHVKLKSHSALQSYFAAQWPLLVAVFRRSMQMLKRPKTCFGCLYRIRLELMQRWVLKMLGTCAECIVGR